VAGWASIRGEPRVSVPAKPKELVVAGSNAENRWVSTQWAARNENAALPKERGVSFPSALEV